MQLFATTNPSLSLQICLFWRVYVNRIIQFVFFQYLAASFTKFHVFNIHTHYIMNQYFIPLYGWIILHCMNSPQFICWFTSRWTFGSFLPFGCCWIVLIGNHFRCIQIYLTNIEESSSNWTYFPSALDPTPLHRLPAPRPQFCQFQFHLLPAPLLLPNINQLLTLPASVSGSCLFPSFIIFIIFYDVVINCV